MPGAMSWTRLLSTTREGATEVETASIGRSEFQRDYDRIIYSSSFRRLQDKTQVVPLAESDYVRTRLTHSLEAASVGRSLGMEVGLAISKEYRGAFDFATRVSAASLARDLGNTRYGHSGEAAIQHWFANSETA